MDFKKGWANAKWEDNFFDLRDDFEKNVRKDIEVAVTRVLKLR
jgi:hypothetical protein